MPLNIFHKAGTVFLGLAFVLFLAYFMMAGGGAVVSQRDREKNEGLKKALRRVWQIVLFLAVMSYANLLPGFVEKPTVQILDAGLAIVKPLAAKVPFLNGFL